jgi:hypothetical protein
VFVEARLEAAPDVFGTAEPADRDGVAGAPGAETAHQVQAAAVGQADVADEQVPLRGQERRTAPAP